MSASGRDMQREWKILAAVHLNSHTRDAIERANQLATAFGGDLVLLHVRDRAFSNEDRCARWLQEATADVPCPVNIQRVTLPGEPAPTIIQYADGIDANVILVTPQARRHWAPLWKRSVTAKILAATNKPVLLVDPQVGETKLRYLRRTILLVPRLDGTDEPLIEWANTLAARFAADIKILYVLPETSEALLSRGLPQDAGPLSKTVAMDRIRAFGERLSAAYRVSIVTGSLEKSIIVAARHTRPDLTIVGRASSGSWAPNCPDPRLLLRKAGCSILTVPVAATLRDHRALRTDISSAARTLNSIRSLSAV